MENGIIEKGTGRERVYNFLVEYITQNGYAPSVREIADGTFINSTASVHDCLQMLEIMGKIKIKKKTSRAIKVIGFEFVKMEESV